MATLSGPQQPLRARFGPFRIDEAEALLERDGAPVDVPPRAFQVLCELARRPGQLVSKDSLIDAVWGHRHVNESVLKNLVSQLRQALGDDARESRFIQTAARRGYRFVAPVVEASMPAAPAPAVGFGGAAQPLRADDVLVGRDEALDRLQQALAAARAGRRQVVFVLGEAGAGKSKLVERFAASAGVRTGFGQCIEQGGSGEPYMPVLEAWNGLCRAPGGDAIVRTMREVAPTWLLQLPWFVRDEDRRQLQAEAAGATQDRMLREFGELLDRVAQDAPVLLVLEDLHWSDDATVQLLGYLAQRRGQAAVMVLGAFRPADLILEDHPLAALRQQLRARRLVTEIDVEPLSEAEIAGSLEARLGPGLPEAFVQTLHAHTSGLPLFVASVVDELLETGALAPTPAGWRCPAGEALPVPRNLLGLLESQVARLPAEHQQVLGAASVAGVDFLHIPLADVLGLDPAALEPVLLDLSRRGGWLQPLGALPLPDGRVGARYAFAHAMHRQVLYERLPAAQRLQWHRGWAAALQRLEGAAAPELAAPRALHHELGGQPLLAAAQLAWVAERALERGAAPEALAHVRHALALAAGGLDPPTELQLRVTEGVALTRLHVMADGQVAAAFERALALRAEQAPAWPRALQGAWWGHYVRAETGPARELAGRMLARAAAGDRALQVAAHNAMGLVQMLAGDLEPARRELQAALELQDGGEPLASAGGFVQDPGTEARVALALVCWLSGEPRRARELAHGAAALAVSRRHGLSEVTALSVAAIVHALARDWPAVRACTERVQAVIGSHGLPATPSDFGWLHGRALVALGQVDVGLREMRNAARTAEACGMRSGLCGYHHHHVQACIEAGDFAQARESVDAGIALADSQGGNVVLPGLLVQRAELLHRAGDTVAAGGSLERAITLARRTGSAFFELLALDAARRLQPGLADDRRLGELLALYDGDPSPRLAAIRASRMGH